MFRETDKRRKTQEEAAAAGPGGSGPTRPPTLGDPPQRPVAPVKPTLSRAPAVACRGDRPGASACHPRLCS